MNIQIMNHHAAKNTLAAEKDKYHLLIATNWFTTDNSPPSFLGYAKSYLHLEFDDIEFPREHHKVPERKDIEKALEWSEGKDPLICSCHAGISRSSALAYIVACKMEAHPRLALSVLNPNRHYPNRLIVQYGSEILKNPDIFKEYQDWITKILLTL